jgi:hypothetical protein
LPRRSGGLPNFRHDEMKLAIVRRIFDIEHGQRLE